MDYENEVKPCPCCGAPENECVEFDDEVDDE